MAFTAEQFYNIYGYWRPGEDPSQAPSWVPTFEPQDYVTGVSGVPVPLNVEYFATEETAEEVMKRSMATSVASVPYAGAGGPEQSTAMERWVVFSDGTACNAGLLAAHFLHSPEKEFPGVAEHAMWHDIDSARVAGQKLPK